jgi:negative regulator of flagellin synthesis FlgM
MSKIDNNSARSNFFPKSKTANNNVSSRALNPGYIQRNDPTRQRELESTTNGHAKVQIPNAVRDFAKIKSAVDRAPDIDNTDKISKLKAQINSGTYKVDYDALADKILSSEF